MFGKESAGCPGEVTRASDACDKEQHLSTVRLADAIFSQIASSGREQDGDSGGADGVSGPRGRPQVSQDQLISLSTLFGKNFSKAVEIVDKGGVQCLVARESGRRAFQVQGKAAGDLYLVFPEHYCTCHAFFHEVVSKGDATHCKHMLAARVADSLGLCTVREADDEDVAKLLLSYTSSR